MFRKLFLLTLLVNCFQLLRSQSISPDVMGSSGKYASAGGNSIEFTVGEIVVSTLNASGNMVTQGFHQTYSTSSSINEVDLNLTIHVYPNPTTDWVNISVDSKEQVDFFIAVYDETGRKVLDQVNASESFVQLNLSYLAAGTYFVTLMQMNQLPIKTIKIQKLSNQ